MCECKVNYICSVYRCEVYVMSVVSILRGKGEKRVMKEEEGRELIIEVKRLNNQ